MKATALFDCQADEPETELSFVKDDAFADVEHATGDDGWYEATLVRTGRRGLVPCNYLRIDEHTATTAVKKAAPPPPPASRKPSVHQGDADANKPRVAPIPPPPRRKESAVSSITASQPSVHALKQVSVPSPVVEAHSGVDAGRLPSSAFGVTLRPSGRILGDALAAKHDAATNAPSSQVAVPVCKGNAPSEVSKPKPPPPPQRKKQDKVLVKAANSQHTADDGHTSTAAAASSSDHPLAAPASKPSSSRVHAAILAFEASGDTDGGSLDTNSTVTPGRTRTPESFQPASSNRASGTVSADVPPMLPPRPGSAHSQGSIRIHRAATTGSAKRGPAPPLPHPAGASVLRSQSTSFSCPPAPTPPKRSDAHPLASTTGQMPHAKSPLISGVPDEATQRYRTAFQQWDRDGDGYLEGYEIRVLWRRSRLARAELRAIWSLADTDADGRLNPREFCIGMWLIDERLRGRPVPPVLPPMMRL
ncbi:hypothetical protein THASP1DRAFT_31341 [Thamnocephalis sphaerospora]|uniref:SH3 domain-containing protein n=1 Tax=Thamnocephalis sphaerospora TaxID=78915 RepID=A0A4P9XLT7_9FUNG|nr:hypothetical protein THASP1DRAFT_31341 [Thamnocephalis sphaerospora]|eukprot:RKP06844.1 hypothetical protein THASP1DRAFT_31341 [Thamnocephalis sphaerospora]